MIRCPVCGAENEAGSRFCYNCGAVLNEPEPAQPAEAAPPPAPAPAATVGAAPPGGGAAPPPVPPPTPPEWRMAPLPAEETPHRRRTWLWIVLGIVAACVLICVVVSVWGATLGKGDIEHLGTWVAKQATKAVKTPTPTGR